MASKDASGRIKIHRLTFSRSLAFWLVQQAREKWGLELEVKRAGFEVGRALDPGEESPSGAYAVASGKTGLVLRASLRREAAELMSDGSSRRVKELWLLPGVETDEG